MRKLEMNQMVAIEGGQSSNRPNLSVLLAQVFSFALVLLPLLGALVGLSLFVSF